MWGRAGVLTAAIVGACALAPSGAAAATIKVTTTGEVPPDGCTLRLAISSANSNSNVGACERKGGGGEDTILLRGGKTYARSVLLNTDEDANASGDLDITGPTRIKVRGDGKARIDATENDRVLHILADARLTASRLVLRNGLDYVDGPGGGGILNEGRLELSSSEVIENESPVGAECSCGGGILVAGRTDLRKVGVIQNDAVEGGGGLYVDLGRLTARAVTVSGNHAETGGGAVVAGADAAAEFKGSTFSTNTATGENASFGGGGAIFATAVTGSTVRLVNSTISGNFAHGNGGGIGGYFADIRMNGVTVTGNWADVDADGNGHGGGIYEPVAFRNSIVSRNTDANPVDPVHDCFATNDDPAHNLVGLGTGCSLEGSNVGDDGPLLGVLQDNGGPTETHALAKTSPARGRAGNDAPAKDQRGKTRDRHPDIGAYER